MIRRPFAFRAVTALCFLAFAGPAWGQHVVRLHRPTGQIAFGADAYDASFSDLPGNGSRTLFQLIDLRLAGSVFHPRVLTFDIGLRPRFEQRSWTGEPESPPGSLFGLDGRAGIQLFERGKIRLRADAIRLSTDATERDLEERDFRYREYRVLLESRFRIMPTRIEYRDWRGNTDLLRPLGTDLLRDEKTRSLRVLARSSKTVLEYEHQDYEELIFGRQVSSDRANATHILGRPNGSNLRSLIQYLERRGSISSRTFRWSELARISHGRRAYSDLELRFQDQDSQNGSLQGWFAAARPWADLSRYFGVGFHGQAETTRFNLGRRTSYRAQPRARILAPLPAGASVSLQGGYGYEWHEQNTGDDGIVQIIDERHVVDDFGAFLLDEPNVDETSVFITSDDGALVFQRGLDYRVTTRGALTEIVALPGGRLSPGDVVLANYESRLLPDGTANAIAADYALQVGFRGLSLYHRRSVIDPVSMGNSALFTPVRDYDDLAAGAIFRSATPIGAVNLQAEYRSTSSLGTVFENVTVRGGLSTRLARSLTASLRLAWLSGENDRSPVKRFDGGLSLNWRPMRSLAILGALDVYRGTELGRRDEFIGGGLGAEWSWRQVRLTARYDYQSWDTVRQQKQSRFRVALRRLF